MNQLYNMIEGVFPNTEILLIYYGGSIAYGLEDESSDKDLTVVLDGFNGILHILVGEYDVFAYSKEEFINRQHFDDSVIPYYKQAADTLFGYNKNEYYVNPLFDDELKALLQVDNKSFIVNHLTSLLEYAKSRLEINPQSKTHYHIFRVRGMLDHFDKVNQYELIVEEPWYSKMLDYKNNCKNDIGKGYIEEIKNQLDYLENYRNEMIESGMG